VAEIIALKTALVNFITTGKGKQEKFAEYRKRRCGAEFPLAIDASERIECALYCYTKPDGRFYL
jgi:hypothetical protein